MKRKISILLTLVIVVSSALLLAACNQSESTSTTNPVVDVTTSEPAADVLICGVTNFEPMNYKDENGDWIGFDTEFAQLVAKKLGMEVRFQEIEWGNKYLELDAGSISCIWNGFTANSLDEGIRRSDKVDFSYSYMLNQQCVVVKALDVDDYTSTETLAGKKAVAEKGSAGEAAATEIVGEGATVLGVTAQVNAFTELKSGASDFAVVDILLAQKLVGKGDYADLAIADIELDSELYAIAFKKGSSLTAKVNEVILELEKSGELQELAEKYHLENSLKVNQDPID